MQPAWSAGCDTPRPVEWWACKRVGSDALVAGWVSVSVAGSWGDHEVSVAHRVSDGGLFEKSEEQQPASPAGAPVEPERELVEIVLEVGLGDAARRDYLRRFYSIRSELPTHYDLVVNTDTFTVEQAANLVVQAAGRGAWTGR